MSKSKSGDVVSIPTILLVVFVVLKLIPAGDPGKHQHLLNWSWWWILAPLWIPLALFFAIVIIALMCFAIYKLLWGRYG